MNGSEYMHCDVAFAPALLITNMHPIRKQRSAISYHPHHPTYQHFKRDHWGVCEGCIRHPRYSETNPDVTTESCGFDSLSSADVDAFKKAIYDEKRLPESTAPQQRSSEADEETPTGTKFGCIGAVCTAWMSLVRALATGSHKPSE